MVLLPVCILIYSMQPGIKKNVCPLKKNACLTFLNCLLSKSYSITCTFIKEYSVTMNNDAIVCNKRRIGYECLDIGQTRYQICIGFRTTYERMPKSYVFLWSKCM